MNAYWRFPFEFYIRISFSSAAEKRTSTHIAVFARFQRAFVNKNQRTSFDSQFTRGHCWFAYFVRHVTTYFAIVDIARIQYGQNRHVRRYKLEAIELFRVFVDQWIVVDFPANMTWFQWVGFDYTKYLRTFAFWNYVSGFVYSRCWRIFGIMNDRIWLINSFFFWWTNKRTKLTFHVQFEHDI